MTQAKKTCHFELKTNALILCNLGMIVFSGLSVRGAAILPLSTGSTVIQPHNECR